MRTVFRSRRGAAAFTLIEVMIVIALIAVVASLAGPPFREYIQMQRLRSVHAQLNTDLAYARSEAISRGTYVQMRVQSSSDMTCYIIYTRTTSAENDPCDCTAAPGSRCPTTATVEVKTVIAPASEGVVLAAAGTSPSNILTITPRLGGSDAPPPAEGVAAADVQFDVKLADGTRKFRSGMSISGRVKSCSPDGSVAGAPTSCN